MIHHGCCTQLGGPSASSSLRASPGEAVAAVITRRAMVTRTSLTLLLLVLGLGNSTARYYSQFFGDNLPPDNPRQVIISSIIYMSTYLTSQQTNRQIVLNNSIARVVSNLHLVCRVMIPIPLLNFIFSINKNINIVNKGHLLYCGVNARVAKCLDTIFKCKSTSRCLYPNMSHYLNL